MTDKKIWEFYEELNEIVYVVDMYSHEIVYMNRRARETYGINAMEELKGKKCYELLAGSLMPCTMCTNQKLKTGHFLEEIRYNPFIKKKLGMKRTMVEEAGKRYRFDLAIDMGAGEWKDGEGEENEAMINEGLRISLSAPTPEKSINTLLEYLGQSLSSGRVYIFEEMEGGVFSNTYEWCAKGVLPQKENLQNVPRSVVRLWYQRFHMGKNVIVKNVESIRETEPEIYEYLEPQNIQTLVVSPLVSEKKIIGFYGVDNPPGKYLNHITTMFQIWGHFIVSLLRRRNLVRRLEEMCFQDQLTGIGNRHAMHEYIDGLHLQKSIGIVYCDVMGLKRMNDTKGHEVGDQLLIRASDCLKRQFDGYALFRVGGDEFLILCLQIEEEELEERVKALRADMKKKDAVMAIGYVWKPAITEDMDGLIRRADERMYEEKRAWYGREADGENC